MSQPEQRDSLSIGDIRIEDKTPQLVEVWVCPECGYWRQREETGVHVVFRGKDPGERHRLVPEHYVLERVVR